MVDRLINATDVLNTALNTYPSTMTTGGTAAANVAAFATDCATAAAAGKPLWIKPGIYPFGTNTVTTVDLAGTSGLEIFGNGAVLQVPVITGVGNSIVRFTTESGWADYDVSAFTHSTTSGGTPAMGTTGEVSSLTLSTGPGSWTRGDIVSIRSNDPLLYGHLDGVAGLNSLELNWQHEMNRVLSAATTTSLYLANKTRRAFTPASGNHYCKLRKYNNSGIKLIIRGIVLDVTGGDPWGTTVITANRPKTVFEIFGFDHPVVDRTCITRSVWQGDYTFAYTVGALYQADVVKAPNKASDSSANLGYCPNFYGPNLMPRIGYRDQQYSRHATTTWSEAAQVTITGLTTAGATTVMSVSGFSTGSPSNSSINVSDYIYLRGLVGTISAFNGLKATITAFGGTSTAPTSISFNLDSTGLAYTSGGTGDLMANPATKVYPAGGLHYGECDTLVIEGGTVMNPSGAIDDEHENVVGVIARNRVAINGSAYSYEDTNGRIINNRAAAATYENYYVSGFGQVAQFHSFSQNHGVENHILCRNFTIRNESNRAGSNPLFSVFTGTANTLTDKRKLTLQNMDTAGGYLVWLSMPVGSPAVHLKNSTFHGDWGHIATPLSSMFTIDAGDFTCEDTEFDFTDMVTATVGRIAVIGAGNTSSNVLFRNCHFKNVKGTGKGLFTIAGSGVTLTFERCTYTADPAASAGSIGQMIDPGAFTSVVNLLDLYVRNVAKLDTTKSIISKTTGTVVTGLKENVRGDAAFVIVGSAGSGTVTLSATTAGT